MKVLEGTWWIEEPIWFQQCYHLLPSTKHLNLPEQHLAVASEPAWAEQGGLAKAEAHQRGAPSWYHQQICGWSSSDITGDGLKRWCLMKISRRSAKCSKDFQGKVGFKPQVALAHPSPSHRKCVQVKRLRADAEVDDASGNGISRSDPSGPQAATRNPIEIQII